MFNLLHRKEVSEMSITTNEKALQLHKEWQGKLETLSKARVRTREDLALAYTPGVAEQIGRAHV